MVALWRVGMRCFFVCGGVRRGEVGLGWIGGEGRGGEGEGRGEGDVYRCIENVHLLLIQKPHLPRRHGRILVQIRPRRVDDGYVVFLIACAPPVESVTQSYDSFRHSVPPSIPSIPHTYILRA